MGQLSQRKRRQTELMESSDAMLSRSLLEGPLEVRLFLGLVDWFRGCGMLGFLGFGFNGPWGL